MVTLRPMEQEEFDTFMARQRQNYPAERARNFSSPVEREREQAERQFADLLPQGRATSGHHFWMVLAAPGEAIGQLWVFLLADRERAFIYYIAIDEPHRGKGFGRQTLAALDAWLTEQGVRVVALNVFGDNPVAQHLYATSGYRVTNSTMQKRL